MIPRIIHYCWFGGNPLPDSARQYIDKWRALNPDFRIMEWNESNFPIDAFTYSAEACRMKNWAFVSDVCRLYALQSCGGLYLDTDMELLQPLDRFLNDKSFTGSEGPVMGTAIIGAEAGCEWINVFLEFYRKRHFVNIFGKPVRTPNTKLFSRYIQPLLSPENQPKIYPKDYFYPELSGSGQPQITPETVAVHHFMASWRRRRSLAERMAIMARGFKVRWF